MIQKSELAEPRILPGKQLHAGGRQQIGVARPDAGATIAGWGAIGLSGTGLITLKLGAWYGARLVYRHGVGQRH